MPALRFFIMIFSVPSLALRREIEKGTGSLRKVTEREGNVTDKRREEGWMAIEERVEGRGMWKI